MLQQVQQLNRDLHRCRRFRCPGTQELGVASPPDFGPESRDLRGPAIAHRRGSVAAHLVGDHVSSHRRVRVAQFPADVPDQLRRLPAVPPPRRDGQTQEAGDLPANGLHPARCLLRSQQPQVFPQTALVTPADRVHRRAHRRHDELLL